MASSTTRLLRSLETERRQYLAFLLVFLAAVATAALGERLGVNFFARFLGPVAPTLAVVSAGVLGALALAVLVSNGWFAIRRAADLQGPLRAVGLAAAFGAVIIAADFVIVFPAGLNAPFPGSLLFYPAIAFAAEVLFHLVPLAPLLVLASRALGPERQAPAIAICLLFVALLEPTFQIMLGVPRHPSIWVPAFVWCHIAAINVVQLVIFRRHDFLSMLSFRLAYYLVWHVGWGHVRLHVLF